MDCEPRMELRKARPWSVALVVAAVVSAFASFASAQSDKALAGKEHALVVVVHPDNGISDVDAATLRDIFLGRKKAWSDGKRLVPLNQRGGTVERATFDRTVLQMAVEEVEKHWVDERIRGRMGAPKEVPARIVQHLVARLPGGIAYLRASEVTDQVKPLSIGGKEPGQPGYLLALPSGF